MREPTYSDAILSLTPNAKFGIYGTTLDGLEWPEQSSSRPSDEDIEAELKKLKDDYDAQEYARKREAEYPTIKELVVALYDTDDKADIEAKRAEVKKKYPKP